MGAAETCRLSSAHGLTLLGDGVRLIRIALRYIRRQTIIARLNRCKFFNEFKKHSYLLPPSRTERRSGLTACGTTVLANQANYRQD